MNRAPVIDVHTHMLTKEWLSLLEQHGGPRYSLKEVAGGLKAIHLDGSPFMTPVPNMFDWEARIANMNKARVDIAITSLTCPNVFWGSPEVSLKAARIMNDDMARAQKQWPDRIRWFASLPWQHEKLALEELARACGNGAVGVMVLANIDGKSLTDERFASVWKEIDRRALPVLVHPSAPPGTKDLGLQEFQLTAPIGFTFDTSLAVARCIYDGFFDRYPNLKLIASHGGGALPYLVGRLDICWDNIPAARSKTVEPPRNYMRRIYVDTVVFRQDVLEMCVSVCGTDNVLYGSDYPHTIGDMAGCLSRVDALPDLTREKVKGWNAQRIFRL
ncbi:MAG TPA: amidohydrolase family protein [Burkholderiales bacterium]|nr:amidohydrolase family protein [Burkholderiales bacterium]